MGAPGKSGACPPSNLRALVQAVGPRAQSRPRRVLPWASSAGHPLPGSSPLGSKSLQQDSGEDPLTLMEGEEAKAICSLGIESNSLALFWVKGTCCRGKLGRKTCLRLNGKRNTHLPTPEALNRETTIRPTPRPRQRYPAAARAVQQEPPASGGRAGSLRCTDAKHVCAISGRDRGLRGKFRG